MDPKFETQAWTRTVSSVFLFLLGSNIMTTKINWLTPFDKNPNRSVNLKRPIPQPPKLICPLRASQQIYVNNFLMSALLTNIILRASNYNVVKCRLTAYRTLSQPNEQHKWKARRAKREVGRFCFPTPLSTQYSATINIGRRADINHFNRNSCGWQRACALKRSLELVGAQAQADSYAHFAHLLHLRAHKWALNASVYAKISRTAAQRVDQRPVPLAASQRRWQ